MSDFDADEFFAKDAERILALQKHRGAAMGGEEDRCDNCGAHGYVGLCFTCSDQIETMYRRHF